jgi:tetratricopeptide (TPR) repeat protein
MSEPPREQKADQVSSGAARENCQPFSVWLEICSGTMAHDAAMPHLQHAAQCRYCSTLLAEANAALEEEVTPEEESILATLHTSTPTGQSLLAKRLYAETSAEKASVVAHTRVKWGFLIPVLSWGAAVACVIAITILLVFREPPDTRLLAEAYNQQRPSELRLPETEPGPVASPTRGNVTTADSSELLRLKLRTNESFEKRPNDPAVRQMLGRIALVEHQGETALSNFEIAQVLDPKLPGLLFDMASAHFELGETTGRSSEYGQAADLLRRYLADNPNDSVALFNEALCWERQGVNTEAISTFEAALAVEKDPKWRQEIQNHLAKLKQSQALELSPALLQEHLTPAAFLSSRHDKPGYFELLLGVAGRDWLPRRGLDPQIDNALRKLATLGIAHHDYWIADMLATPASDQQRIADQTLSQALIASSRGNADEALAQADKAMRLYRTLGNRAGYLRAAVEHIYTLQRMGLSEDCLREAATLADDRQLSRYSWLQIYLQLETGAAHAMLGDSMRDRKIASAAARSAVIAELPLSHLRAASFVTNDDVRLQHYESAWNEATSGLRAADSVMGAGMPRFQLLTALSSVAKDWNIRWTQTSLAAAAAVAAKSTPNQQTLAYAMEELALDELKIGDLGQASRSFDEADRSLSSLTDGLAKRRYAADWKTDRELLIARRLGPDSAAKALAREENGYQQMDAALPRLHYYTVYADLLRQKGDLAASTREALVAISDAELRLAHFHTAADGQGWPEETRTAYEILIFDLAHQSQDPALSLRAWEWLQSAPSREGLSFAGNISPESLDRALPALPAREHGHLTLVIAKVLDRYIAWSISSDQQQFVAEKILDATPESIMQRRDAFVRLCADPLSSMQDLRFLGRSLYDDLLGPFENQIAQAGQLDLDLDSSLAGIPFAALENSSGRYLGLDHNLTFLPAGWTGIASNSQPGERADRLPDLATVVILDESPAPSKSPIPAEYDEAIEIKRLFPSAQLRSAILWRQGSDLNLGGPADLKTTLSRAAVLHYVGHGIDDDATEDVSPASGESVLNLSKGSLPHCRLAVLAACQTFHERETNARDVPSFARIVLSAGASNVLATQWDVDSRITSRLMVHFYSALAAHQTFSEALRQAQQFVESDPASRHPYFWAGFQLVGD